MFSRFLLFFWAAGAGALRGGDRPAQGFAWLRAWRGASLPASPCSFVDGHHVSQAGGARGEPDVVPHSPQNLAPSSTSTTFPEPEEPQASRAWCFTSRKTLLFRRRAPRFPNLRGTRRAGRGASLPANPCSFVDKHHVFGARGAAGEPDVVLHSPQTLALSSTGTTFLKPEGPEVSRTWCLTPRKTLLLRRQAPRLWGQRRRRRTGRGASLPANPCSFVDGHHVF